MRRSRSALHLPAGRRQNICQGRGLSIWNQGQVWFCQLAVGDWARHCWPCMTAKGDWGIVHGAWSGPVAAGSEAKHAGASCKSGQQGVACHASCRYCRGCKGLICLHLGLPLQSFDLESLPGGRVRVKDQASLHMLNTTQCCSVLAGGGTALSANLAVGDEAAGVGGKVVAPHGGFGPLLDRPPDLPGSRHVSHACQAEALPSQSATQTA